MRIQLTENFYLTPCGTSSFDITEEMKGTRKGVETKTPYARAYGLPLEMAVEKVIHLLTRETEETLTLEQFLEEYKKQSSRVLKSLELSPIKI